MAKDTFIIQAQDKSVMIGKESFWFDYKSCDCLMSLITWFYISVNNRDLPNSKRFRFIRRTIGNNGLFFDRVFEIEQEIEHLI
jgi:hypothetical protein